MAQMHPPSTSCKQAVLIVQSANGQDQELLNGIKMYSQEHHPKAGAAQQSPAQRPVETPAVKDKFISEALRFIHSNACGGITVADVLSEVPLSRRILERRFQQMLGRTPHEEIMSARLTHVKQLLAETNLTLVSIADRTGFKHTEYLSVAFKREVGISPSQFRKLYAGEKLPVNY